MTDHDTSKGEIELLSFRLGDQEYCVDVMSVQEIRGWTPATPLPYAPPHVKGVINLRGIVLPVIDLSARLGMPPLECSDRNVIIVVQIGARTCGLLVDAVSDILSIKAEDEQPLPDMARDPDANFLRALTLIEGRLIRILDLTMIVPCQKGEAA